MLHLALVSSFSTEVPKVFTTKVQKSNLIEGSGSKQMLFKKLHKKGLSYIVFQCTNRTTCHSVNNFPHIIHHE